MRRKKPQPLKLFIAYYSRFGALKALADEVAAGARDLDPARFNVHFHAIEDQPVGELRPGEDSGDPVRRRAQLLNRIAAADAVVVGAPSYFGSMASPVKRFFEDCLTAEFPLLADRSRAWRVWRFHDKIGAAFTSSGTPHGGNEKTLRSILTMLMHLGMIVVTPGQADPLLEHQGAPYGPTAVTGPAGDWSPEVAERECARELGRQVVEKALWLRWGKEEWGRLRQVHPDVPRV